MSILSVFFVKTFLHLDVRCLIAALCFPICQHSWWSETGRREVIDARLDLPTIRGGGGWGERKEIILLYQLVSNPQPSHLPRTVSLWKLASLSKSVAISLHYLPLLFNINFFLISSFLLPPSLSILLLPLSRPCTTPRIWLFLKLCLTITLSSPSLRLTFLPRFHPSDVREEKERGSASVIGQGRQHPQLWLTVLRGCVI